MSLTNNNNNNDDDGSSPPSPPRSITAPSFNTFLQNASLASRSRCTPNSSSSPSSSSGTKKRTCHIFMGNEAGDMDSLISALALAYVVSLHNNPTTTTDHHFYIPLISIPRNDMPFRRDATLILEKCGIGPSTLLYVTDEDVTSLLFHNDDDDDDDEIFITLTDHNQLISPLSHLSSRVESIYDHHDDVGCHPHVISPRRNIAFSSSSSDGGGRALVGSTCTLVVERLMKEETDDESSSSSSMMMKNDDMTIDAALSLSLVGTILLDTANNDERVGKGTDRDRRAVEFLKERTDWSVFAGLVPGCRSTTSLGDDDDDDDDSLRRCYCTPPDGQLLYEWLRDSKFDEAFWKSMSTRDRLRIDYKRFQSLLPHGSSSGGGGGGSSGTTAITTCDSFGMSSILMSLEEMTGEDNFARDAKQYARDCGVEDLLGVTSVIFDKNDGRMMRELLLIGKSQVVESMSKFLMSDERAKSLEVRENKDLSVKLLSSPDGGFQDRDDDDDDDMRVRAFRVENGKASRKQLAPIMLKHWDDLLNG